MTRNHVTVQQIMQISKEVNRTKTIPELTEELSVNIQSIYRTIRRLRKEVIKITKAHRK